MALATAMLIVVLDGISAGSGSAVTMGRTGMAITGVAQGSSRPAECIAAPSLGAADKHRRANVWDTAREPRLGPYCDRLARGYGELLLSPDQAYRDAEAAGRLLSTRAAPWVLKARASWRLGQHGRSMEEFEKARSLDSHALDEPAALRDWAAVLARGGRTEAALGAYRALGPRLSLAFGAEEEAAILVEAAEVASSLGMAGIEDAVAFLEGARRLAIRNTARLHLLAQLALALDRQGDEVQAASVAELVPRRSDGLPVLDGTERGTSELDAAVAFVTESSAARAALERWNRYLSGPGATGPWAAHAARHREQLVRRGASAGGNRARARSAGTPPTSRGTTAPGTAPPGTAPPGTAVGTVPASLEPIR